MHTHEYSVCVLNEVTPLGLTMHSPKNIHYLRKTPDMKNFLLNCWSGLSKRLQKQHRLQQLLLLVIC